MLGLLGPERKMGVGQLGVLKRSLMAHRSAARTPLCCFSGPLTLPPPPVLLRNRKNIFSGSIETILEGFSFSKQLYKNNSNNNNNKNQCLPPIPSLRVAMKGMWSQIKDSSALCTSRLATGCLRCPSFGGPHTSCHQFNLVSL